MRKIYFGCSIAGGRDHAHVYEDIVKYIKGTGAHVVTEIFAAKELTQDVGMHMDPALVWKRDTGWLESSDAVIAEVTTPSLGVGYELGRAEELNKPMLVLFYKESGKRLSPMISGNPKVQVFEYSDIIETKEVIAEFVKKLL